jgi:hypothetical protein
LRVGLPKASHRISVFWSVSVASETSQILVANPSTTASGVSAIASLGMPLRHAQLCRGGQLMCLKAQILRLFYFKKLWSIAYGSTGITEYKMD